MYVERVQGLAAKSPLPWQPEAHTPRALRVRQQWRLSEQKGCGVN